jgi:hypothetical protein
MGFNIKRGHHATGGFGHPNPPGRMASSTITLLVSGCLCGRWPKTGPQNLAVKAYKQLKKTQKYFCVAAV